MRYSEETFRKMARSGLKMVFSGAESGSDETLARMNKGGTATAELAIELARRMREHGIVPEYSFVLGSPPDPEEDTRRTFEFIRRVKRVNPATEVVLYVHTPVALDGTLYDEARRHGFTFPETLDPSSDVRDPLIQGARWPATGRMLSGMLDWEYRGLPRSRPNFLYFFFPTSERAAFDTISPFSSSLMRPSSTRWDATPATQETKSPWFR